MNSTKFIPTQGEENILQKQPKQKENQNASFHPTSMDASIYFIHQYSKLIHDQVLASKHQNHEEHSKETKTQISEHRTLIFTFNSQEKLTLRSSWKNSVSQLQEELKNISYEARTAKNLKNPQTEPLNITEISNEFEGFLDKFELTYFNNTRLTGGHFFLRESENIFCFYLSESKGKLDSFKAASRNGWQRRNVFIQFHPDSYQEFLQSASCANGSNFFPVTNMRDSDQLAKTLWYANFNNSLETQNMENLGIGGNVKLTFQSLTLPAYLNFIGSEKPHWPIPNCLDDSNWSNLEPEMLVKSQSFDKESLLKMIPFDEYLVYSPLMTEKLGSSGSQDFVLFTACKLGLKAVGFIETAERLVQDGRVKLFKIFIGPFEFSELYQSLADPLSGGFQKYLQRIPQFYEYFLHNAMGEKKWNELCRTRIKNEFPLPSALVESKNVIKNLLRQRCKVELTNLVESTGASHVNRTNKRGNSYHPVVFPSIHQLKSDSGSLNRLIARFQNCYQIFVASCDPEIGESNAFKECQLPQVLFKHSLPIHRMTDFSEIMHKKRDLRPLFNENERDLFEILKEVPCLSEEMTSANFVSGDIFGNPYKKEKRNREPSKLARKRAFLLPEIKDEEGFVVEDDENLSLQSEQVEEVIMSPMSIDEIDFKEIEDVENEIVIDGSVVVLNNEQEIENSNLPSSYDLMALEKLIRSPGGLKAKTTLLETLPVISRTEDLNCLLDLCRRYRRISLSPLIIDRLRKM